MSDKALGMLKHMRRQILGQPAPYVVVREVATSIGVDPGGSECHALVEELLRRRHLQRYPSPSLTAHGLYRLTDSGISAADEADSPTPMLQAPRRAYSAGRGGGECSEDRRIMQNNQTIQDAKRLLAAMSTNHSEARVASPYGLDRPFSPSWADAEQAGLDRIRRDAAMSWLIENNVLEREDEAESL